MKYVENNHYTGERALFKTSDTSFRNCLFDDGESPLKECKNLLVNRSSFGYKYPLWYGEKLYVKPEFRKHPLFVVLKLCLE